MPCPFPGMDPYLENTDLWQGFHNAYITYACNALQGVLPANYVAVIEVRIYLEHGPDREPVSPSRIPDVELVRTGPSVSGQRAGVVHPVALPGYLVETETVERREAYLTLRSLPAGDVVTSIELLSPTNKRPGEGRDQYRVKQHQLLMAGANLVEIDLLRGGAHALLPKESRLSELPPFHYVASICRSADSHLCQVFTWSLRDPLPSIPIPLSAGDPELTLDLQEVFRTTYEGGAFWKLLQYHEDPHPPLAGEDRAWARGLLGETGMNIA